MAGAKATDEAKRLALEWVKRNPNSPAAIAYLKHAAMGGTLPAIRARQTTEKGLGSKPVPKAQNRNRK